MYGAAHLYKIDGCHHILGHRAAKSGECQNDIKERHRGGAGGIGDWEYNRGDH